MEIGGAEFAFQPETEATPLQVFDVVVVHGNMLKRGKEGKLKLSFDGKMRAIAAAEMLRRGICSNLVITGGKTAGERELSEAEMVKTFLTGRYKKGPGSRFEALDPEKIFLEEESKDTSANLVNVRDLMKKEGWRSVALLSNQYHLRRVVELAGNLGLSANVISAETGLIFRDKRFQEVVDNYLSFPETIKKEKKERFFRILLLFDPKGTLPKITSSLFRR